MTSSILSSQALLKRAEAVIPGGVNSPVRAFTQVGGSPRFISRGDGPYIYDEDDNQYVDFIGSWGPMILGHASKIQLDALMSAAKKGTSFGAPTAAEVNFAELLTSMIPGLDMLRLVSSGTEATMSAVRLARAYTSREYIIKFDGCYHGHADSFLVKAGSGVATQGITGSPGVLEANALKTISIEYNDISLLRRTLELIGPEKIACICVEPVAGNMGLILPEANYLSTMRSLCDEFGIVLLFDEVMSGFRVSLAGASGLYNVVPDLFCYGKVIGGGLPLAAFGGKLEIMSMLAPLGPVYQAGTLSGNPLAVSSGLATLEYLREMNPYSDLSMRSAQLVSGMLEVAKRNSIQLSATSMGSMFGFFFSEKLPKNFSEVKATNIKLFQKFFHLMLDEGVYFAPSAFEAGFIGITHNSDLIDKVIESCDKAFKLLNNS